MQKHILNHSYTILYQVNNTEMVDKKDFEFVCCNTLLRIMMHFLFADSVFHTWLNIPLLLFLYLGTRIELGVKVC